MGFYKYLKQHGVVKTAQRALRKISGVDQIEKEVDTLYYYLNNFTDIRKLQTTDADLKNVQDCCTELLLIFNNLCNKNGLTYWLDYGTLLGAIRHNGFIPWDDDLDVAMPRADYDKLINLIQKDIEGTGLKIRCGGYFDNRGPMERLSFDYKALNTGAWLDIFPVDTLCSDKKADELKEIVKYDTKKYVKKYSNLRDKSNIASIEEYKRQFYKNIPEGKERILFHGGEFPGCIDFVMNFEDIFPLQLHKFGPYEFNVPKNSYLYLSECYGADFMKYPKDGLEHHGDPGGSVSSRPERTNTDMEKENDYLHNLAMNFS